MSRADFFHSTKIVLLGMGVAQVIPILGSLAIARIYAPTEFGIFAAWLGIVLVAAVMVTGRLEMALAIEPDGGPRRFAMVATLAAIVVGGLGLCIIAIVAYQYVPVLRSQAPGLVMIFLPASLLIAVVQAWQSWAAAEGLYRELSWIRIAQAFGVTSLQIVVGYFKPDAFTLAAAHTVGVAAGIGIATYFMPIPSFRPWSTLYPKLSAFWSLHRRFPLFALPADVINAASGQLPMVLIASKFGAESSGLFALTVRVLGAPIGLLGAAILDVFKRAASSSYRDKGNCKADYLETFKALSLCGCLLAIGIIIVAEPLFAWLFGEPWREAGVIAMWLMPMFAMRFVASPLSYVFYIAGRQQIDLAWQCALFAVTLSSFVFSSTFERALKTYAAGYAALYVIYLLLSYHYSKGEQRDRNN